jgi:hypothetical protein
MCLRILIAVAVLSLTFLLTSLHHRISALTAANPPVWKLFARCTFPSISPKSNPLVWTDGDPSSDHAVRRVREPSDAALRRLSRKLVLLESVLKTRVEHSQTPLQDIRQLPSRRPPATCG